MKTRIPAHLPPSLRLRAEDTLQLARADLPAQFRQTTGQALRRTGPMAALAILGRLRCTGKEATQGNPSTVLLWHTRKVFAEDGLAHMRTVLREHQPLMPFDFLASQPALVGATLHPFLPELDQAICMPCAQEDDEATWSRTLQLAALWLAEGRCQRVLCQQQAHDALQCEVRTLSLGRS
jgi:hypothetical protein